MSYVAIASTATGPEHCRYEVVGALERDTDRYAAPK
jgi:hypothetical protein